MPPLYVTTQGAKLRLRKRRWVVEKDDAPVTTVPVIHVDGVILIGNVSVTTPALSYLLAHDVPTAFLTVHGRYKGRLVGPVDGHAQLRLHQYARVTDEDWALATARALVTGKLHNTGTFLRRYARRMRNDPARSSPLSDAADRVDGGIERAAHCRTANSLRGVEGRAAAAYFGVFRHLIRAPGWTFETRNRRPPRDPVNALLSFGYTLLTQQVASAVRTVGLDPYLGVLHAPAYNRPGLALDLVEAFRAIVVDSVVLGCLNGGQITPDAFTYETGGEYPVLLNDEGRAAFIRAFETRLARAFTHPDLGEKVSYRRCFELQARRMARCLQTGATYAPFTVR